MTPAKEALSIRHEAEETAAVFPALLIEAVGDILMSAVLEHLNWCLNQPESQASQGIAGQTQTDSKIRDETGH